MAEKVIFEFRAEQREGGCRAEFAAGDEVAAFRSFVAACCPGLGDPATSYAARRKRGRQRSGERMREMLDFLQQMYADLYGEE